METLSINVLVWAGIFFCISQSAMFSGLNLALIGISRLRLEVEATAGNPSAVKILKFNAGLFFMPCAWDRCWRRYYIFPSCCCTR